MWFVRGLQCVAVFFILQTHGALSDRDSCTVNPESCRWRIFDELAEFSRSEVLKVLASSAKHLAENVKTGEGFPFISDEKFAEVMGVLFGISPDGTSKGNYAFHVWRAAYNYMADMWRNLNFEKALKLDHGNLNELKEYYLAPMDTLVESLVRSFPDHAGHDKLALLVTQALVPAATWSKIFMNCILEVTHAAREWRDGRMTPGMSFKITLSSIFNLMKDLAGKLNAIHDLRYSKFQGEGDSVYARKFDVLGKELANRKVGFLSGLLQRISFMATRALHFQTVFGEVRKECYSVKEKLGFHLFEGGSPVDKEHLDVVMNNANAGRAEACERYRAKMGPTEHSQQDFVDAQYKLISDSTKKAERKIPSDVLMIDAVAHNMLGDVEPACMLRFLCYAGMVRTEEEQKGQQLPEIDLILGLVVSGTTYFNGVMDYSRIRKIGNAKMAEAIYKGYHNDCDAYVSLKDCYDHKEFLDPAHKQ